MWEDLFHVCAKDRIGGGKGPELQPSLFSQAWLWKQCDQLPLAPATFPSPPWETVDQNTTYLPYVAFARCFAAAMRQVTTKTHMMEAEESRMQKLHPKIIVSIVNMMSLLRYSSHQRNSALVCCMTCVISIVSKTDSINKNLNRLPD